jgi:hypothetical protein
MARRSASIINAVSAPYQAVPFSHYTNCTVAQTQSGSIDQSHHFYESRLTAKILNAKNLNATEKVKFLKIIEGL